MSGASEEVFSFHCNACGKCCNSPPAMTVEELFHHEDRFIGCLTVRIVERPTADTRLPGGEPLHADDLAKWQDFVDDTSFALPGALPPHLRIQLGTQGYEHPIFDNRCPALAPDGRCSIHDDRKPAMCSAVPLEPALPDGLQRVVLRRRMEEAGWMGAASIAKGQRPSVSFQPMVQGRRVVDADHRRALAARRAQTRAEAARWHASVFKSLASELVCNVRRNSIKHGGYLVVSMAPVLRALATESEVSSERCDRYAKRQGALIEATIAQALTQGNKDHRAATTALRQFYEHYQRLVETAPA